MAWHQITTVFNFCLTLEHRLNQITQNTENTNDYCNCKPMERLDTRAISGHKVTRYKSKNKPA